MTILNKILMTILIIALLMFIILTIIEKELTYKCYKILKGVQTNG